MAVVWSKKTGNTCYEVRSAGKSLRLYTDGVFHSQYNPTQLLTGHVWDLLMLPAFFYPENTIKRVLVLGVGGGAVLHMLREFVAPDYIAGIELNPQHVFVARRFFGLKHKTIELIEADAIDWLQCYQGEKFDMIIDDLFGEEDGEPVSVVKANRTWFACMLKHLSKEGVIVRNFINRDELLNSAGLKNAYMAEKFPSVFQFNSCFNENFVAAYVRTPVNSGQLRKNLIAMPGLNPQLKGSRLRYSIRQLR
ncbi:hypothetical protein MNBD_GAMMA11-885 [hydrothermal vent metagenome]|uniref:Methyltransferase domain-containing protein n=1 Tax=hydrothermal vent metagenome TaxID=652676 RepID=A0A3B0XUY3_9ZZZZ